MGRKKYDDLIPEEVESHDEMSETAGSGYETQMAENELEVFDKFLRRTDEARRSNRELSRELSQTNDIMGRLSHSLDTETNSFKLNVKRAEDSVRTIETATRDMRRYSEAAEELNRHLKESGNGAIVPFRVQMYWFVVILASILFGASGMSKLVMAALGRTWAIISIAVMAALMAIGAIIIYQLTHRR